MRIEDITEPNTQSDVNPIKDGFMFVRHLVFALEKAIDSAAHYKLSGDDKLTAGTFGEGQHQTGKQTFEFTNHRIVLIKGNDTMDSADIYVGLNVHLAEYMGLIAPDTANTTNVEGRNSLHISRDGCIVTSRFRTFATYSYVGHPNIDFLELRNQVNWEIIGLDNGWFEQVFNAKDRVVRVLNNVCESSVVGDTRTNVLAEAKVESVRNDGQEYYEPTHLRYVPVRQKELDVIEIRLDDLSGQLVNLGVGITSTVLHFKRVIKSG